MGKAIGVLVRSSPIWKSRCWESAISRDRLSSVVCDWLSRNVMALLLSFWGFLSIFWVDLAAKAEG